MKSIIRQVEMPDEILIADDGSRKETKQLIDSYRDKISVPIHHVWHEDNGFRKTIILNQALAKCTSDYIIQIDGDCILPSKFIKDHKSFADRDYYVYGTRVHLKMSQVKEIEKKEKIDFSFFNAALKKRARRLRSPILAQNSKQEAVLSRKLRGCNMAFWREDILKINGFNESIHGWGRSDSELAARMLNIGIKARRMKFMGFVYHLDHPVNDKGRLGDNSKIESNTINNKITWADNGLDKYL